MQIECSSAQDGVIAVDEINEGELLQEKLREMDVDVEQWEQFQEMTKGQLVRCGHGWVLA